MSSKLNKGDAATFFDCGIYFPTRTLYIGSADSSDAEGESGTDFRMAERAVKGLHILDATGRQDITVIMNNIGGDQYHGMAIYDAISACRSPVTIIGTGPVMSMGAWIMQAADHRILMPHARMMIHYGTSGYVGHAKDMYKWAAENKRMDKLMEDCFLDRITNKHPTYSRAKLQGLLNFDTILSADEAVALGLADNIYNEEPE